MSDTHQMDAVLRLLAESQHLMKTGVWEWDLIEQKYICTDYIYQFFAAEAMQSPSHFLELVAAADRQHLMDYLDLVYASPQIEFPAIEYRILQSGFPHWVSSRFRLYLDQANQPSRLVGTLQDIHHQHALQEQAQKQQKLREDILTSSQDGFLMAGTDGHILEVNQCFVELTGYCREELLGKHLQEWQPEVAALLDFNHQQAMTQHARFSFEFQSVDAHQQIRELEVSAALCDYEEGQRLVAFFRDISQRNKIQQALKLNQQRLKIATDVAGLGVWEYNLETEQFYVNDRLKEMYGFARDVDFSDVIEQARSKIYVDDREAHATARAAIAERQPAFAYSYRMHIHDEIRYFHISGEHCVLNQSDLYIGVIQDQTEAKRAEQKIREANESLEKRVQERTLELDSANQAKSRFLANMSHEIRTPMNVILGFADLMVQESSLSEMARYRLESIRNSGQHLLALIHDILEVSKIEAGRVELNPVPLDFYRLLTDTQRMFRDATLKKGVGFYFELDSATPQYVLIDETKIREILFNLIGNAVKFTRQGEIRLKVAYDRESKELLADLSDTGYGISREEQSRLFKPFEQTSSGLQTRKGTGLGLTICREYLKLMGGSIQVQSELGQGTSFQIRLPFEAIPETDVPVNTEQVITGLASDQEPVALLIVDDHEANRQVLRQILSPFGFLLAEAENGREAIEHIENKDFQAVLMDLSMPEMDGLTAIRELRHRGYAELPIIVVTANAFEENRQEVFDAGGNGFVSKPFRQQEILKQLKEIAGIGFSYETVSEKTEEVRASEQIRIPDQAWLVDFRQAIASFEPDEVEAQLQLIADTYPEFCQQVELWTQEFRYPELEDWLLSLGV